MVQFILIKLTIYVGKIGCTLLVYCLKKQTHTFVSKEKYEI